VPVPWALALGALVLYVWCLPTDVHYGGDCGEMCCSAYTLGVSHPTGYPLYQMLTKLITVLVPLGTIAWRVAFAAALWGALAVGLVTLAVLRITDDPWAAAGAGLLLACDSNFLALSVVSLAYSLNMAILALLVLAHARYERTEDVRWVNVIGLTYGLGAVHHVTLGLNAPASLLFFIIVLARRGPDGRRRLARLPGLAARAACFGAPVLALYAYEPLRSALHPAMCWGHTETWAGFKAHLTASMYHSNLATITPALARRFALNNLDVLSYDQGWGVALVAVACAAPFLSRVTGRARPSGAWLAFCLASIAVNLNFAAHYDVGNRINYALPVHLMAAVLAGVGLAAGRTWCRSLVGVPASPLRFELTLALPVALLPFLPTPWLGDGPLPRALHWGSMRGNEHASRQIDAILDDLPTGATLVSALDELTNAFWYREIIDGRRHDVHLVQQAFIDKDDEQARLFGHIDAALANGPVFLDFWLPYLGERYGFVMHNATCRVFPLGAEPPLELGPSAAAPGVRLPDCPDWTLLSARLTSPVPGDRADSGLPGVKMRVLGAVHATLAAARGQDQAYDLLTLSMEEGTDKWLAGKAPSPTAVLNESTGQVERWWVTRWPLHLAAPVEDRDLLATLTVAIPLWAPERTIAGRHEMRLGVVARDDARWPRLSGDVRAAREATVPVGAFSILYR
jgi:hypothetical protein